MSNRSDRSIALDQAVAGMTLSNHILDDNRGVLLPAGAVLSDAAIASLRRRGVERVAIAGAPVSDAELQAACAHRLLRLNRLFRRSAEQPAGRALLDCLAGYRQDKP